MNQISVQRAVEYLRIAYGRPKRERATDPWPFILWENVAYLANDARRGKALAVLQKRAGLGPAQVLAAANEVLLEVARFGIMPESRVEKLRECARTALGEFDGDLKQILDWPAAKARKALQRFPGIGGPGAEKILMFCHRHAALALESNGLRVLVRLGFGEESKNYSATYRNVQKAISAEIQDGYPWLIEAHQLLRRHGQEMCTRSHPRCQDCTLARHCPSCETQI